jgi:sporulation protein YlmC with PRC-barrel domain
MIRTLLATTAVAALMTAGAIAQTATPAAPAAPAATEAAPAPVTTEAAPAAGAAVESGAAEETDVDEPWSFENGYVAVDSDNLGSELIDQPVYSSNGDDAEEIGNISDLIFTEDGRISGVVIGVGGFLGIGEKNVAVPFDMLEFTLAADNTERWVVPTTADALTAAPDFVWEEDEPADADAGAMAPADGAATGTMTPADSTMAPAAPADTMAPAAPATN